MMTTEAMQSGVAREPGMPDLNRHPRMTAKVVIQFGEHSLKGYTERAMWSADDAAEDSMAAEKLSPPVLLLGAETPERISMRDAKAAFFVHSFDGMGQDAIRFHDDLAHADRLWVRVVFQDGEVVEGMVENSRDFLVQEDFMLVPNDPEGNNWLVFVCKRQLQAFHVLGVRSSA